MTLVTFLKIIGVANDSTFLGKSVNLLLRVKNFIGFVNEIFLVVACRLSLTR